MCVLFFSFYFIFSLRSDSVLCEVYSWIYDAIFIKCDLFLFYGNEEILINLPLNYKCYYIPTNSFRKVQ